MERIGPVHGGCEEKAKKRKRILEIEMGFTGRSLVDSMRGFGIHEMCLHHREARLLLGPRGLALAGRERLM